MGWAMVNGRILPLRDARIPADDPGFTLGWTVFETMLVREGAVPRLAEHLARLAASAEQTGIPLPEVAPEVVTLARKASVPSRLRVTLSGSGLRVLTLEPVSKDRWGQGVRCARGPSVTSPLLSGAVKHGSRAAWVAGVKRAGVDDLLLVDSDGRFTEATSAGIVAIVDGALYTAPFDGRILESTTVSALLDVAEAQGVPIERRGADAEGPWDGLYIASATRGLAPVLELDGRALAGWEPVGQALMAALTA